MTDFSVNVNKLALLRNSREGLFPDLIIFSRQALELGCSGITVHPRPDQRHIRPSDIQNLKRLLADFPGKELNIEGYPSDDFFQLISEIKPHQVTLVPDPPEALTSSFGWDTQAHKATLKTHVQLLDALGCRSVLFVDLESCDMDALAEISPDRVELYTGPYVDQFSANKQVAVSGYIALAKRISALGIGINAGHDLNLENVDYFLSQVSDVQEVSIGHAVICESLELGWQTVISRYLDICQAY